MKFKKAKTPSATLDTAVVGDVDSTSKVASKKVLLIIVVLLILLIICSVAYYFFVYKNNNDVSQEPAAVAVVALTDDQLKAAASKDVDPKKDIEGARLKAEALSRLEDPAGAAVVYGQIEAAGTGNYEDTINYAGVVLLTGDYQKAIALLEAAVKELNESSASQDVKTTETEKLTTKINALKKEAGL